jgi:hypothetical protein
MKRTLLSLALLGAASAVAFAGVTKEDIKKLVAAGVGDDVIIAYVRANGGIASLSADDVVELKGVGASDKVLSSVLGEKAPAAKEAVQAPPLSEAPSAGAAPVQRETIVLREPTYVERPVYVQQPVYVGPSYYSTPVYYRPSPYYYSNCYPRYSYAYYPRYSSYSCGPRYYSRPSVGVGYTRYSGRGAVSVGVRW